MKLLHFLTIYINFNVRTHPLTRVETLDPQNDKPKVTNKYAKNTCFFCFCCSVLDGLFHPDGIQVLDAPATDVYDRVLVLH